MDMLSTSIDLCKNIIDLVLRKKELKQDSKLRISEILKEISLILEDTANKLLIDEYPHSNCVVLRKLSDSLHFQLIDYVDVDTLDELHQSLINSSNIEQEFTKRKDYDTIPKILECSGQFKSLSLLLKF